MNLQEKLQEQARALDLGPSQGDKSNIVNLPTKDREADFHDIVPDFAISLTDAKQRFQMLQEFVKEMMVAGQDYGIVSGVTKPTLLKPGAEKLTEIFGFSKQVNITNRMEDWVQGLFSYEVKVSLINKRTGHLEAEGVGLCNTKESEYAGQNPFTLANTVLKMAKKRALIDAVLSATRSSGIFTQDVESLALPNKNIPGQKTKPVQGENGPRQQLVGKITTAQLKKIETLSKKLGMSAAQGQGLIKEMFGVFSVNQLNKGQASALIQHLMALPV